MESELQERVGFESDPTVYLTDLVECTYAYVGGVLSFCPGAKDRDHRGIFSYFSILVERAERLSPRKRIK